MHWLQRYRAQTQLGQILVEQALISADQLGEALREQHRTGARLGDILARWKLASARQIRAALRTQRNLRLAGAIATALLGPAQAMAAAALPVAAPIVRGASTQRSSMPQLSESELGEVAAQGLADDVLDEQLGAAGQRAANALQNTWQVDVRSGARNTPKDGMQVLAELARLFNPLSHVLAADVSVSGVEAETELPAAQLNADGSLTLRLPRRIGQIRFDHIRVAGSVGGPSFGSIELNQLDLHGTTLTIRGH